MSKAVINEYITQRANGKKASSPKVNFTNNLLEWLPPQSFDYEIASSTLPSLRCRVRANSDKKTIIVLKRDPAGRLVRVKLCNVGEATVSDIAAAYHKIMSKISAGKSTKQKTDTQTLDEVLTAYINDTELAEGTIRNYRIVADIYLRDWRNKPLASISADMCKKRFQQISNKEINNEGGSPRGGPSAANTSMKVLRALFNFMFEETDGNFPVSPTFKLNPSKGRRKKKGQWNEEKPRTGRIDVSDLSRWWEATEALPEEYGGNGTMARDYLQFILLTGMRRREATQLTWDDVTGTSLTVHNTKNGKPLELPITPALLAIINRRPKDIDFLFPISEPRRFMSWVSKRSGVDFTLHDLRRTFAGYAEHHCDLPEKIISILLNHTTDNNITSRYTGEVGLVKKAEKLRQIQDFILAVVSGKSEVVTFNREVLA